jgi:putative PIN family toxin of toxin-antitoxin system
VIDTSVLISSLAGRWARDLLDAIGQGRLRPVVSSALLDELRDVMGRERLRRWFTAADAEDVTSVLAAQGLVIEPRVVVNACRDPNDNYLLSLAETSDADYLVTRDEDLLVLVEWKGTLIVPPRVFLRLLAQTRRQ